MIHLGYNTNGFAHHRLEDAIAILADFGYTSVAITLDYFALNPFALGTPVTPELWLTQCDAIRQLLDKHEMRCVIETGTRFLLDPRRKHQPTLLGATKAARARRVDFLMRSIAMAERLHADAVSFWSGTPSEPTPDAALWYRLVDCCRQLCVEAAARKVKLAFEPEPGMFIDTMAKFAELHHRVAHPNFGLTLDVGHLHCQGELPIRPHIHHWKDWLWNVHIEDMRYGVHDHLMFGEGEMDFPPIFRALREIRYDGGVHVELSRHSYDAMQAAGKSLAFMQRCGG